MSLYKTFLGVDFDRLAPALQKIHSSAGNSSWAGKAEATSGTNPLARLVRRIIGFPKGGQVLDVRVDITVGAQEEIWQRQFNDKPFHSRLFWRPEFGQGQLAERFGPMTFLMHIPVYGDGSLGMDVVRGWFLGMPMPRFFLPHSDTREFQDDEGRFNFDVRVTLPFVGLMVHYRGWLAAIPDKE